MKKDGIKTDKDNDGLRESRVEVAKGDGTLKRKDGKELCRKSKTDMR